jgi:hypothetical protein
VAWPSLICTNPQLALLLVPLPPLPLLALAQSATSLTRFVLECEVGLPLMLIG